MSENHEKPFLPQNKFMFTNINDSDSEDDQEYIKEQDEIIKRENQDMIGKPQQFEIPKPDKVLRVTETPDTLLYRNQLAKKDVDITTDDYDSYHDFIRRRGLYNYKNKARYNTYHVNIDSSQRDTETSLITDEPITLTNTALSFETINSNSSSQKQLVKINIPNNSFSINEIFTLTGVEKKTTVVRASSTTMVFTVGSEYVKIPANPNVLITLPQQPTIINNVITKTKTQLQFETLEAIDTTYMYVEISGFLGYPTTNYYGNIPINVINNTQQIYFTNPDDVTTITETYIYIDPITHLPVMTSATYDKEDFSDTFSYFFIKLNQPFAGDLSPSHFNVTLVFQHIGGVPYNYINAEYPLDRNHKYGYHTVYSQETNYISYTVPMNTYYNTTFGNGSMFVALISQINYGSTNPNNYIVTLGKTFSNVVMVKMTCSVFPNIADVFFTSGTLQNNKLYWQNFDDGTYTYSISIDGGSYDPTTLITEIEDKIYHTQKIVTDSNGIYTSNNYIKMFINTDTNIVKFYSFKEGYLSYPITNISPTITTTSTSASSYTLTIQQTGHNFTTSDIGTVIIFTGFIECMGISATDLNGEHAITSIVNANSYTIAISHINIGTTRTDSKGGNAVKIYVPSLFKLIFTYSDTMGNQLGFRDVGKDVAITNYNTIITNQSAYVDDDVYDSEGTLIKYQNNAVELCGYDYLLLSCQELPNIINYSKTNIDNILAKINLSGQPGKIVYDSFAPTPLYYNDPISFNELHISVYNPDGELVNFHNLNHSFILEVTTLDEIPNGTAIDSYSGREN
jgi:hypothetical protein